MTVHPLIVSMWENLNDPAMLAAAKPRFRRHSRTLAQPTAYPRVMGFSTAVAAVEALVGELPALRADWESHLTEYDEPLLHVFCGLDVCRYAIAVAEGDDDKEIERLSSAVERLAASNDPDVLNLIHVSFAENFIWGDERERRALARLRPSFGPETAQRFREFEAWAAEAGSFDGSRRVTPE